MIGNYRGDESSSLNAKENSSTVLRRNPAEAQARVLAHTLRVSSRRNSGHLDGVTVFPTDEDIRLHSDPLFRPFRRRVVTGQFLLLSRLARFPSHFRSDISGILYRNLFPVIFVISGTFSDCSNIPFCILCKYC